jgi:hypothetical protein
MPIANYTTKVPAGRSQQEIQDMLTAHGATGILTEYEKGTGRLQSLSFKIDINGKMMGFRLPIKWREARKALIAAGIYRADRDEDYCYRVAWRIMRDWVRAQMAILEMEMVELEEIFLPYAVQRNGRTLFENLIDDPERLLGDGSR